MAKWHFKGPSRWRELYKIWVAKHLLGVRYGPYMIPVRDYWLFIDSYQRIWRVTYSGDHASPFTITLLER